VLPERFGVHYACGDGERQVPMMLHRALYGSLERFMGMLLEQCAGKLPCWLAPEQVRVLPVAEAHVASAAVVVSELAAADIRAGLDTSSETLALRVFRAHNDGVPFALILGNRELASDSVTIRERGGENRTLPRPEAIAYFRRSCAPSV
jgi:threonyl-tRNA synthetase